MGRIPPRERYIHILVEEFRHFLVPQCLTLTRFLVFNFASKQNVATDKSVIEPYDSQIPQQSKWRTSTQGAGSGFWRIQSERHLSISLCCKPRSASQPKPKPPHHRSPTDDHVKLATAIQGTICDPLTNQFLPFLLQSNAANSFAQTHRKFVGKCLGCGCRCRCRCRWR